MTYPLVQLVDAPTSAANVLFDFNDLTLTPKREVHADEFSIGAPELIGEVDAIDPLYGERMVSFTCALTGAKPAVAAALSTLSRRLLARGQGWLRVQLSATSDLLFFRTYRAQPADLSFDEIYTTSATKPERWEVKIDLPCEPMIRGERVVQVAQTVGTNPTSGSNPCSMILPDIAGDAPTPLRFAVTSSEPYSGSTSALMINVYSGSSRRPYQIPVGTGDNMTATGADTSIITSSSFAGGSCRSVSFATSSALDSRFEFDTTPVVAGRYKIMARVHLTNNSTVVRVQAANNSAFTTMRGPVVSVRASTTSATLATWVDLGTLPIPPRRPAMPSDQGPMYASLLGIYVGRTSGTGTFDLDQIMLIPVDAADTTSSRTVIVDGFGPWATAGRSLIIDGDSEDLWSVINSSGVVTSEAPGLIGSLPVGIPGSANVATIYFSTSITSNAETLSRTMQVTVSYYPRFLYVGDS